MTKCAEWWRNLRFSRGGKLLRAAQNIKKKGLKNCKNCLTVIFKMIIIVDCIRAHNLLNVLKLFLKTFSGCLVLRINFYQGIVPFITWDKRKQLSIFKIFLASFDLKLMFYCNSRRLYLRSFLCIKLYFWNKIETKTSLIFFHVEYQIHRNSIFSKWKHCLCWHNKKPFFAHFNFILRHFFFERFP